MTHFQVSDWLVSRQLRFIPRQKCSLVAKREPGLTLGMVGTFSERK